MPSIEEFGRKLKEKYPQYGSIDDRELGLKMLEKHPEYKDRVFDTDPDTQAKIAGVNTETRGVFDAVKKGFSNIKEGIQKSGEELSNTLESGAPEPLKVMKTATGLIKGIISPIAEAAIATPARIVGEVAQNVTGIDVNEAVAQGTQKLVQKGLDTEQAKKAMEGWAQLKETNPEAAMALSTVLDIADIVSNVVGIKGAKMAGEVGLKGAEKSVKATGSAVKLGVESVANKASDIITPIEPGVQTFLEKGGESAKSTKLKKLNAYVKQAEEAVNDFSKPTPLEIAGGEAEKSLKKISQKLTKVGEYKSKVVEGLSDVKVGNIASEARKELRSLLSERLGSALTKSGIKSAPGRVSSVSDKADTNVIKLVDKKLAELGSDPTFRKVDDTIDYIQDILYKRSSNLSVPVNTKVEGVVKGVIGSLNEKLKTLKTGNVATDRLVSEYRKANEAYGKIKGTMDELNKMLGEKGKRAGALMKRVFSPSDAGTKKLFAEVKKLTGIDLVDEATLAKFVMENAGDARQASLLEEAIKGNVTSARSFIAGAAEKVIGKLQNPVGKARRIIERSGKVEKTLLQKAVEVNGKADEAVNEAAKKAGSRLKDFGGKAGLSIEDVKIGRAGYSDDLLQEARKYESEEEFVKAQQGIKIYRGGGFDKEKMTDLGTSFSFDRNVANKFPLDTPNRLPAEEFTIDKNAMVLSWKDIPEEIKKYRPPKPENWPSGKVYSPAVARERNIVKFAKDNGYDAVDLSELHAGSEKEIRVLNADIVGNPNITTPFTSDGNKLQLTDLWKKAHRESGKKYIQGEGGKMKGSVTGMNENIGKVKDGAKKIKERILNEMADFTEYAAKQKNGEKIEYVLDEIRARKIAEQLGINPDVSNWELSKKFGKILEKYNYIR